MARTVSVYDARTHFSELVASVERGEAVTVTRHGKPVARLLPIPTDGKPRVPGAMRGKIEIPAEFWDFTDADSLDWYGEVVEESQE